MYRTLSQLKESINQLIEQQGENSTVAAFIFTKEDVFYYKDDEYFEEEYRLDKEDTNQVLENVGDSDYVYEQVNELIADEVKRIISVVDYDN